MDDIIEAAYSEKNKDLNDMPMAGMMITHGYLPAAKQSPWYVENAV